jgi:hypothetical protein
MGSGPRWGDRIAASVDGQRRIPARIKTPSRWGPQGSEASNARGPLWDGVPDASRPKGLEASRPIRLPAPDYGTSTFHRWKPQMEATDGKSRIQG